MNDRSAVPLKISDYINNRFREDFLCAFRVVRRVNRSVLFEATVTKDDSIYTLWFTSEGSLINEEVAPAFPPDFHDAHSVEDNY
jgi:hypothetical protein